MMIHHSLPAFRSASCREMRLIFDDIDYILRRDELRAASAKKIEEDRKMSGPRGPEGVPGMDRVIKRYGASTERTAAFLKATYPLYRPIEPMADRDSAERFAKTMDTWRSFGGKAAVDYRGGYVPVGVGRGVPPYRPIPVYMPAYTPPPGIRPGMYRPGPGARPGPYGSGPVSEFALPPRTGPRPLTTVDRMRIPTPEGIRMIPLSGFRTDLERRVSPAVYPPEAKVLGMALQAFLMAQRMGNMEGMQKGLTNIQTMLSAYPHLEGLPFGDGITRYGGALALFRVHVGTDGLYISTGLNPGQRIVVRARGEDETTRTVVLGASAKAAIEKTDKTLRAAMRLHNSTGLVVGTVDLNRVEGTNTWTTDVYPEAGQEKAFAERVQAFLKLNPGITATDMPAVRPNPAYKRMALREPQIQTMMKLLQMNGAEQKTEVERLTKLLPDQLTEIGIRDPLKEQLQKSFALIRTPADKARFAVAIRELLAVREADWPNQDAINVLFARSGIVTPPLIPVLLRAELVYGDIFTNPIALDRVNIAALPVRDRAAVQTFLQQLAKNSDEDQMVATQYVIKPILIMHSILNRSA